MVRSAEKSCTGFDKADALIMTGYIQIVIVTIKINK